MKLLAFIAIFLVLASCSNTEFDQKKWQEKVTGQSPQLLYATNRTKDGLFQNPWMPQEEKSLFTLLQWKLTPKESYTEEEKSYLPKVFDPKEKMIGNAKGDYILWIGHATYLIKLGRNYILTDPIFSKRALLPARYVPPPISIEELLNIIDGKLFVLISHNHYDHFDVSSLKELAPNATLITPVNFDSLTKDLGAKERYELDWWEAKELAPNLKVTSLPTQHWSKRIFNSYNTTLWSSYMIEHEGKSVYFGGDSGYFVGYKEFGKKFQSIDYALLPTTAYNPRWFMHYAHMDIKEAIRAFDDLGAKTFIPTQWGTFRLGNNPPGHPALELQREIKRTKRDRNRFKILNIGELLVMP